MIPWFIFAIMSAFMDATSMIFRKQGLYRVHALEFSTTRTLICALCSLAILPFVITGYSLFEIFLIYIVSLLSTAGIIFYTKSLRHMEISTAAPLLNLMPAFLIIWSFIFLSETLTVFHILGIAMLIIGTYVLEIKNHSYFKPIREVIKSKYFIYILFAVIFFSFSALVDKIALNNYTSPMRFLALVWIFISINFLILHTIKYDGWKGVVHTFKTTKMTVILAGVFAFLATLFYYQAASLAFIALVIPVKRLSTLIATFIGGEIFHDHNLLRKIIACIIMVGGAVLVILG